MTINNQLKYKLISPFVAIFKKWQRTRLRRIMYGYRALRNSGEIKRIAEVNNTLTAHRLSLTNKSFSPLLMGMGNVLGETVVRQYLLVLCGGLNLNKVLLSTLGKNKGKVVFYLPKEWRSILTQHGFEVARVRSSVLWQLYLCVALMHGIVRIVKIIVAGLFDGRNLTHDQQGCIGFADLASGNIPKKFENDGSHTIISWYLQWSGRPTGIKEVRHTVQNVQSHKVNGIELTSDRYILPNLRGAYEIVSYAVWGLYASVFSIIEWLRGHWWHVLLLNQAAYAAQARILPKEALARQYLFNNSGWIYRPLWTYEAEYRGSEIIFYFYSTNCESFKRTDDYPPLTYGWEAMTWPRYLVWDEYQADFVRRSVGVQVNISVVGPIWFQSNADKMPKLEKPAVAVFDVTPFRTSRYCILGLDYEYYLPETSNNFLADIADITKHIGAVMLWKRKRNISTAAHPRYRSFADKLSNQEQVQIVDPDISAIRVIESSFAVISMPFTSTALIAVNMGKPSVYYDPTGLLQYDDRAAHGVQIIKTKRRLAEWIEEKNSLNK